MHVKLKRSRKTDFQLLKTCFQIISNEQWNFMDNLTRHEQKNLPNETVCGA